MTQEERIKILEQQVPNLKETLEYIKRELQVMIELLNRLAAGEQ